MLLPWTTIIGLLGLTFVQANDDAPSMNRELDFHYHCPGQQVSSRTLIIAVKYDNFLTTYTNVQNVEWIGRVLYHRQPAGGHYNTGDFRHGMCLPASQGRKCGYSITGTLKATETDGIYGAEVLAPSVTMQCTEPGHKDCGSGKVESCRVIGVPVR